MEVRAFLRLMVSLAPSRSLPPTRFCLRMLLSHFFDLHTYHLSSIRSFAPSKIATNAGFEPCSMATSSRSEFSCFLIDSGSGCSMRSWTSRGPVVAESAGCWREFHSIRNGISPTPCISCGSVSCQESVVPSGVFRLPDLTTPTFTFGEISLTKASRSFTRAAQVISLGAVN